MVNYLYPGDLHAPVCTTTFQEDDIYDIAPCEDHTINFKALKNTWNMMGPGPQSPPPATSKKWMKPAESPEINTTPKPYLPPKKGPQLPVSLNDVVGRRQNLNVVPDKRESATASKLAIPEAFQKDQPKVRPAVKPKPVVMRKPAANGVALASEASAPRLPAKREPANKEPARRKTLMPPDGSPPAATKPPIQTPSAPVLPSRAATKKSPSESSRDKKPISAEIAKKSGSVKETGKPDLTPGQTVTSADGKTYILRPIPAAKGIGPIKPRRPPDVSLPAGM